MFSAILGEESFLDAAGMLFLLFRFMLNFVCAYILIEFVYRRVNNRREYLFTFYIINIAIFFIASVLIGVKMKTGFAFGLFAIFSIIRYRTEQLNIKEMTFLFVNIILAVINSSVTRTVPLTEVLFANVTIVLIVWLLESRWLKVGESSMNIVYENIDLIRADKGEELIRDLQERTGLRVTSFTIESIDYLRDSAKIEVFYE